MKILLVEDHRELSGMIRDHLSARGLVVDVVGSGAEGLTAIALNRYDAVVLDLGLPDMDGMDLLDKLRAKTEGRTATLILTARGELHERVHGLNGGADDYMIKPFDLVELEARLKAVLRRPGARALSVVRVGNIVLHINSNEAEVDSVPLDLSRREWVLLKELLESNGRVVVKDLLEERVYSCDQAVTPNALEAVVSRLRKKLSGAGADHTIEPRRGIGYCLKSVVEL